MLTPLLARVAEWQTRRTQNPLFERTCGFKSHLGHTIEHTIEHKTVSVSGAHATATVRSTVTSKITNAVAPTTANATRKSCHSANAPTLTAVSNPPRR